MPRVAENITAFRQKSIVNKLEDITDILWRDTWFS